MFGEARLFVVVAVLPGPSPLQSPVDLVGVGVPPFASYGTWNDGTVWADISALQTDGTTRTYSGTYTVANGVIVSANISQTS